MGVYEYMLCVYIYVVCVYMLCVYMLCVYVYVCVYVSIVCRRVYIYICVGVWYVCRGIRSTTRWTPARPIHFWCLCDNDDTPGVEKWVQTESRVFGCEVFFSAATINNKNSGPATFYHFCTCETRHRFASHSRWGAARGGS